MGRIARSIYGGAPAAKQIYGISENDRTSCVCVPSFSPLDQISALIDVVSNLEILFRNYFKATGVVLPLHASMRVGARTNPAVGVRVIWRYENPGTVFDRTSDIHRLQLKMIYLNNGWNWRNDPLFRV
jgi:hypothetical protein